MTPAPLSDADLARMGDDDARRHFSDEMRINELVALARDIETGLADAHRAELLAQKDEVLAHGDDLAKDDAGPLLKSDLEGARREWVRVRALLQGA